MSVLAACLCSFDGPTSDRGVHQKSRFMIQETRFFGVLGPEVAAQPSTLDILVSLLSRMHSLDSFEMQYTSTVLFSALEKVLTGLPLLRRVDIWHSPCSGISPFSEFPGDIRHLSFSPAPKVVSPEEAQRVVFDPPDDAEVSMAAAMPSDPRNSRRSYLAFSPLAVRWYPMDRSSHLEPAGLPAGPPAPALGIVDLFPWLESLEIEVVRTDPSLIEDPQYLWVDSEGAKFPSQLKHLSLVDIDNCEPRRAEAPRSGTLHQVDGAANCVGPAPAEKGQRQRKGSASEKGPAPAETAAPAKGRGSRGSHSPPAWEYVTSRVTKVPGAGLVSNIQALRMYSANRLW
ncbi:hypothetical protein B0H13DRAFT_1864456 [Mycena leptocephala]|nr:hypothetical protein B0H13DRAFT_1864456 [Mycena leptocephala]